MPVLMRMEIAAGAEIAINYNANNLRLTDVTWSLAPGLAGRALIWDLSGLLVDFAFEGIGAQGIPGNYRAEIDPEHGQLDLPSGFTHQLSVSSNGTG